MISPEASGTPKHKGRKTFCYNSALYSFSRKQAQAYAAKNNADYVCLETPWEELPGKAFVYHKFYAYFLFSSRHYKEILYVDADMVLQPGCPSVFGSYKRGVVFAAVADASERTDSGRDTNRQRSDACGLPTTHVYFCASLMLLTNQFYKLTQHHWKRTLADAQKQQRHYQHDQTIFNLLVGTHVIHPYRILEDDYGSHRCPGARYAIHLSNKQKLDKVKVQTVIETTNANLVAAATAAPKTRKRRTY